MKPYDPSEDIHSCHLGCTRPLCVEQRAAETEQHRHRCEVRDILALRVAKGRLWLISHLAQIDKIRGTSARLRLEKDIVHQWGKGNRGQRGVWYD